MMSTDSAFFPPVAIGYTLGDQAGIGPEIIAAALQDPSLPRENVTYRLIGAPIDVPKGAMSLASARAAFDHLKLAADALKQGEIDAVVTAPVCKESLHDVGFRWPGQTEFFAETQGVTNYAMCLTGRHLTVGLTTIHTSIKSVPGLLTAAETVRIARLMADFCRAKGIARPRIALAALNPHAGENGAFGEEEQTILSPALEQLRSTCPAAEFSGPCVPDCVYRDAADGLFDAIVAPYHDQALIPLKILDFDNAVNITLGLPRPRVSPDHGTAFGIAGKGLANPASTLSAFRLAVTIARHHAAAL